MGPYVNISFCSIDSSPAGEPRNSAWLTRGRTRKSQRQPDQLRLIIVSSCQNECSHKKCCRSRDRHDGGDGVFCSWYDIMCPVFVCIDFVRFATQNKMDGVAQGLLTSENSVAAAVYNLGLLIAYSIVCTWYPMDRMYFSALKYVHMWCDWVPPLQESNPDLISHTVLKAGRRWHRSTRFDSKHPPQKNVHWWILDLISVMVSVG